MANKNNVPSPVLSLPPLDYEVQYFNNLVRLVNYFIEQQDNPGNMRGTELTLTKTNDNRVNSVPATSLRAGVGYTITSIGTTDFTLYGASSNAVGLRFIAIKDGSSGAGTGQVLTNQQVPAIPSPISAEALTTGTSYTIVSIGTTDFTLIGATSNTVGLAFTASGPGTGTGTAVKATEPGQVWNDSGTLKIVL